MSAATSNIEIRKLDPVADFDFAMNVFERCADYVLLETGEPPSRANVTEFFEGRPPSKEATDKVLLGICDEHRNGVGLIDIIQGYPEPSDWYIGLLMIDPDQRGRGLGKRAVDWVVESARNADVSRLLLCVLDENPRGHAFWIREGFVKRQTTPPWTAGKKTHIRYELMRVDI